jgi:hypothetical protein
VICDSNRIDQSAMRCFVCLHGLFFLYHIINHLVYRPFTCVSMLIFKCRSPVSLHASPGISRVAMNFKKRFRSHFMLGGLLT